MGAVSKTRGFLCCGWLHEKRNMKLSSTQGHIVLTDDVRRLTLAAQGLPRLPRLPRRAYIFTSDPDVPGAISDPTPHIKAWMSELFKCKLPSPKVVVLAHGSCSAVDPDRMLEFIGWLPQLQIAFVCICDPAKGLPEWAWQLSQVSEAEFLA
jgi:hypothetical protein